MTSKKEWALLAAFLLGLLGVVYGSLIAVSHFYFGLVPKKGWPQINVLYEITLPLIAGFVLLCIVGYSFLPKEQEEDGAKYDSS